MRQGIEEIIQFDKKPKEKIRVYTYENAVKRWNIYVLLKINIQYLGLKGQKDQLRPIKCYSVLSGCRLETQIFQSNLYTAF